QAAEATFQLLGRPPQALGDLLGRRQLDRSLSALPEQWLRERGQHDPLHGREQLRHAPARRRRAPRRRHLIERIVCGDRDLVGRLACREHHGRRPENQRHGIARREPGLCQAIGRRRGRRQPGTHVAQPPHPLTLRDLEESTVDVRIVVDRQIGAAPDDEGLPRFDPNARAAEVDQHRARAPGRRHVPLTCRHDQAACRGQAPPGNAPVAASSLVTFIMNVDAAWFAVRMMLTSSITSMMKKPTSAMIVATPPGAATTEAISAMPRPTPIAVVIAAIENDTQKSTIASANLCSSPSIMTHLLYTSSAAGCCRSTRRMYASCALPSQCPVLGSELGMIETVAWVAGAPTLSTQLNPA